MVPLTLGWVGIGLFPLAEPLNEWRKPDVRGGRLLGSLTSSCLEPTEGSDKGSSAGIGDAPIVVFCLIDVQIKIP